MIDAALGALVMLAVVTFAPPHIAAKPSEWLRRAVAAVRKHMRPNQGSGA